MPGLGGDPVECNASDRGTGGVSSAKRVGGDALGSQAGGSGTFAEHDRDGLAGDRVAGNRPSAPAGEQPAWLGSSMAEPGVECGDRVGGGVLPVDDNDDLTDSVLVTKWIRDQVSKTFRPGDP